MLIFYRHFFVWSFLVFYFLSNSSSFIVTGRDENQTGQFVPFCVVSIGSLYPQVLRSKHTSIGIGASFILKIDFIYDECFVFPEGYHAVRILASPQANCSGLAGYVSALIYVFFVSLTFAGSQLNAQLEGWLSQAQSTIRPARAIIAP